MLSSGFERSTTRWKLEPNGVAEVLEHRAVALDDVRARRARGRAPAAYAAAPCSGERDQHHRRRTHAEQRRHRRSAPRGPTGPACAAITTSTSHGATISGATSLASVHTREQRARDERQPGGATGTCPGPQSDRASSRNASRSGRRCPPTESNAKRRDHQRGGGCVGDDGAASGEHVTSATIAAERHHRHDVLHEVDGGDGRPVRRRSCAAPRRRGLGARTRARR